MLDYELFHSMLIAHLDDSSDKILYVFASRDTKKTFAKKHPEIESDYILTVNDIWTYNKLEGLRYKDFIIR